jgi:hypothetical protein
MNNLQELYDEFLRTEPSVGKIKTATTMMIHVCKSLNVPSNEEITVEFFKEIPSSLDNYFFNYPLKATQDKAILSEMIGRIGPIPELKAVLEELLADKDENVRQYALHSLEYCGLKDPSLILPYIERFRKTNDSIMYTMAAYLAGKLSCVKDYHLVLERIEHWFQDEKKFVQEVVKHMLQIRKQGSFKNPVLGDDEIIKWAKEKFGEEIDLTI